MAEKIDISILVLAYNHAPYIRQALDSILAQETTAKYEILIHDDVSTDGTREILKEYARKFSCIHLFLRKKKTSNVNKSVCELLKRSNGRYIALLEGDDCWIGKEKLEKGYVFLKSHPGYSAVYMDCIAINEAGREIKDKSHGRTYDWKGIYTIHDYWNSRRYPGHASTMMAKNIFKSLPKEDIAVIYEAHDIMGDIGDMMLFAMEGPIYRINETGSARRIVRRKGKNNWSSIALSRDSVAEHVHADAVLLDYFEKRTGNYAMVGEKWKWEYETIKNHLLKSLSLAEFMVRGRVFVKIVYGLLNNRLHMKRKK